jgi:hypothetical protein
MSNSINYVVTYDSDITSYIGLFTKSLMLMTVNGSPTSAPILNLQFQRNIAPSEDNATLTVAGIQRIQSAREVYVYRINSDGTLTLKFRGMTTNPHYHVGADALSTDVMINGLWFSLSTRLFQIAGKSPPPLQPNTNPYLIYLNPTLGLNFGQLWTDIITLAYQNAYSTGHLPPLHLANLDNNGMVNPNIPSLTDFDTIVVNDNMNLQYQSVSAVVDRLVTSALFNANENSPFLAEYRLDIGDYPEPIQTTLTAGITEGVPTASLTVASTTGFAAGQTISVGTGGILEILAVTGVTLPHTINIISFTFAYNHSIGDIVSSVVGLYSPQLPTATVMLFDPVHSKLGNGNNRSGIKIGDNSLDPAGTSPDALKYPMAWVEFGVTNGYKPIDTIVFTEGDNMVVADLTYDYLSMNNSYVLSGGSFQGSDVVALPIDNQRSIAEFGLKQTNQSLSNVVDQGEISRFVGTSINFYQHPIPNIVIKPDYVYASTHILYPGDYILANIPSLAGVLEDSNGNLLEGSYSSETGELICLAFTARIKTIDTTWNPTDGEDITITLTFPVQNVPIAEWNAANNTQQQGSYGGAMQFMYTTVAPAAKTMLGRGRQGEGTATYQSGGDFITNRNNPTTVKVTDGKGGEGVIPDSASYDIPMFASIIQNALNAIVNSPVPPSVPTTVKSVKGDDILIYQFGVEVDSPAVASTTISSSNNVYLTVLQPDGMVVFDSVISLNQAVNILSLISKSHTTPLGNTSAPFFTDSQGNANVSGKYQIILRNPNAVSLIPNPVFATLAPPIVTINSTSGAGPSIYSVIVVACSDSGGLTPFAMTYPGTEGSIEAIISLNVSWNSVPRAGSYNIYVVNSGLSGQYNMFAYENVATVTAPTTTAVVGVSGLPGYEPFPPFAQLSGVAAVNTGSATLVNNETYWYAITGVDAAGNESASSAAGSWSKDGTQDTEPSIGAPQSIFVSWLTVANVVSYNIYRGTGALYGDLTLITTDVTDTYFLDDGSYDTSSTIAPITPSISSYAFSYILYANYSFQANPAQTKSITNQGNNPSTAIIYDPTQQRIYQPQPYVAP